MHYTTTKDDDRVVATLTAQINTDIEFRATFLEDLAAEANDLPKTLRDGALRDGALRLAAHPALTVEQLEAAFAELVRFVRLRRDLECGDAAPRDVDDDLLDRHYDHALDLVCNQVETSLVPLLHGFDFTEACRTCLKSRRAAKVRRRTPTTPTCWQHHVEAAHPAGGAS